MTFDLAKASRYNASHERLDHFKPLGVAAGASWEAVTTAVHTFQVAHGLDDDGMCGSATLRALFAAEGFIAPVLPFAYPKSLAALEALYGHKVVLHPHPTNAARLIPGKDLDANLCRFDFRVRGGIDHVTLHRSVGPGLLAAYTFACDMAQHLPFDVQGTVCRRKNWDPKAKPSTHSAGGAIDCDPPTNGRNDLTPSLPQRFFSAMRACGVACGRDFQASDPMHFQCIGDDAIDAIPIVRQ